MLKATVIAMITLIPCLLSAQARFIQSGRLEFERKINLHRQVDGMEDDMWVKPMLERQPIFKTSNFNLYFDSTSTIYKPAIEENYNEQAWLAGPAKQNIVYSDLAAKRSTSRKKIFEQQYIISDSIRNIQWKIQDEKRTIAGFECRKAVGVICDSVYVVAFYTEEIMVSGGPESFAGLPGMILGIVIPRLHTTWYATRLVLATPSREEFQVSTKGQQTDIKKLTQTLVSSMKAWGNRGPRNIWWSLL